MLQATHIYEKPVVRFCKVDGGNSRYTYMIYNVIQKKYIFMYTIKFERNQQIRKVSTTAPHCVEYKKVPFRVQNPQKLYFNNYFIHHI